MAFQNLVIAIGGMIVQTVVNSFGVAFIAGYTATCKLYGILEVAATSYGFAMVTYTGQNLGAGKQTGSRRNQNRCFDRCADFLCHYRTDVSVRTKYSGTFHLCRCSPGQSGCGGCMALFADYEQLLMGTVYFTYRPQRDPGNGNTVIPLVSGIFEFIMRTGATLILPVLLEKMEFYSQRCWHGWAPIWC